MRYAQRGGYTPAGQQRRERLPDLDGLVEHFNSWFIRLPSVRRLSFTTLSVLHTLSTRSPLRLSELTATEQVTQSAITQLVTRLERDGLVGRRPDPADGRAALVHITPAGLAIVAARRADRVTRLARLTDRLSPAERSARSAVSRSSSGGVIAAPPSNRRCRSACIPRQRAVACRADAEPGGQAAAGTVQPGACRDGSAARHDGDLGGSQAIPGDQAQHR